MEFNYLYGKQAEQFAYVNIPKALIYEEAFSDVSLDAKLLERVQSAPGRPCKLYLKKLSYVCEV